MLRCKKSLDHCNRNNSLVTILATTYDCFTKKIDYVFYGFNGVINPVGMLGVRAGGGGGECRHDCFCSDALA